jgi:RNA polymerase sigma-70 factor (ECF subfamily)
MSVTDQEIIRRILSGDDRAFALLIERHKDRAMTLAVRMLKDRREAEEALQDAFVRAFRALPGFQLKSSFSTWFYRIVFNVCSSMLSRKGDERLLSIERDDDNETGIELASTDDTPDIRLEHEEFRSIVKTEIDKMDQEYSAVLTLFYIQDMSYEEIVEVTGLPIGTVKNRLFRARNVLRDAVRKHLEVNHEAA